MVFPLGSLSSSYSLPKLRVLRPGMRVNEGFDLYLPRAQWALEGEGNEEEKNILTREFQKKIIESTQRCPCCPRSRPVDAAPTQMIFYQKKGNFLKKQQ